MAIDVKRAYFYAPATRPIYVEIPEEDRTKDDTANVAVLNLSLYGTRDAAVNWVQTYTKVLKSAGFIVGRHSAQNFYHPHRGLAVTVHGDDFTSTGSEEQLQWLDKLLGGAFEIKTETLGPDPKKHVQEMRVLNRVLSWHEWGLGYEADPRHAEMVINEMGMGNAKAVGTPGSR
jgi:hypothetical protein